MTATALLHDIESTGIRLHVVGDRLRAEIPAGSDLGPYREQIIANKPALLTLLALQDEIVRIATAAWDTFDRAAYDELWRRWHDLNVETA